MLALDLVRHRLADVMQQCRDFRDAHISANFLSNHTSHLGHLSRVLQHVLPVTRPEFQLTEQSLHFLRDADDASFAHGVLAGLLDFFIDLFFRLGDNFFNAGRVDTAIFHQHLEAQSSHLPANWIKTRQHDHTRRIIHQNIDTSLALQRLNVATFFADDPTFHLIISQLDGRDCSLSRHLAAHPLHRRE